MKKIIRNITPKPIGRFLIRLGEYYRRHYAYTSKKQYFPSQEGAFNTLKFLGWLPKTCIDVGAYHGSWATMFRTVFPTSKVLMIEGQLSKEVILKKEADNDPINLFFEIALLGATEGKEVSFVEMETGSSVFEESSPYSRVKRNVKLQTLDSLLENYPHFKEANAIKLDTQGYELEVLKGASNLLKTLEVILLEVSLVQINKGAPSFLEVVDWLNTRQFKLFDFCSQIRRKDGVLWQTDLMFIRDGAFPNLEAKLTRDNWG